MTNNNFSKTAPQISAGLEATAWALGDIYHDSDKGGVDDFRFWVIKTPASPGRGVFIALQQIGGADAPLELDISVRDDDGHGEPIEGDPTISLVGVDPIIMAAVATTAARQGCAFGRLG